MKKLGLLLVSTILLSGCSPTNGVVSKEDIENSSYQQVKSILEEQRNIYYTPQDVKMFVSKLKELNDNVDQKDDFSYIDMITQEINRTENGSFLYETELSGHLDENSRVDFQKLVNVLDETIGKGVKLYLEKNIDADIDPDGYGKTTKIGRVWVNISAGNPEIYSSEYKNTLPENTKLLKNNIKLIIQTRDIKNEKYKQLVSGIMTDELMLDSIRVGKEQSVIKLNNLESKNYYNYKMKGSAVNYDLFVKDDKINKVRMSIISSSDEKISNDDLKPLGKLANTLEFNTEDVKVLEEIKMNIKNDKKSKISTSSKNFDFNYNKIQNKNYGHANTNLMELTIEKRK